MTNADLSFRTRREAERGPQQFQESMRIEVAVGIIAESRDISVEAARHHLRDAALQSGLSEAAHADRLITPERPDDPR